MHNLWNHICSHLPQHIPWSMLDPETTIWTYSLNNPPGAPPNNRSFLGNAHPTFNQRSLVRMNGRNMYSTGHIPWYSPSPFSRHLVIQATFDPLQGLPSSTTALDTEILCQLQGVWPGDRPQPIPRVPPGDPYEQGLILLGRFVYPLKNIPWTFVKWVNDSFSVACAVYPTYLTLGKRKVSSLAYIPWMGTC